MERREENEEVELRDLSGMSLFFGKKFFFDVAGISGNFPTLYQRHTYIYFVEVFF